MLKMIRECEEAKIPKPVYYYNMSGFFVELKKDIYNDEYLRGLNLNERQIKAVLYVKEKGKISNKEYQELNTISKRTATNELLIL